MMIFLRFPSHATFRKFGGMPIESVGTFQLLYFISNAWPGFFLFLVKFPLMAAYKSNTAISRMCLRVASRNRLPSGILARGVISFLRTSRFLGRPLVLTQSRAMLM